MLSNKQRKNKEAGKKLAVRIVAFLLAALMVLGVAYTLIAFMTLETSAASSGVLDTSSLKDGGDVLISVGLMYGSNITTGFQVTSTTGYEIGIQRLEGDREFYGIWDITDSVISCTSDANLGKSGMSFVISDDWSTPTVVGGYHVQVDCDDLSRQEFANLMYNNYYGIEAAGVYAIPAYVYTGYALRLGSFATWNEAAAYVDYFTQLFPDRYVSVVSPTENAVSVINPNTNRILFEFDCGAWSDSYIGLRAYEDYNGNTYMKTPAGNVYDGVFCFKRYNNGTTDGVSLINILPLEAYLAGVLPFEITNTWPIEVQKEFAITVRSFTLTHLNKHSTYGFDLCNTTDCQVYKGAGRINDSVMQAVTETRGKVMAYKGNIVTAYYSSTMGGVTVSVKDAWGGTNDVPYLRAIETPWEDYLNHSHGFWIYEETPQKIAQQLRDKGYSQIKGDIEDIEILEFAENSTYVKKLRLTDIYGNSVTLTYSDNIRTTLSSILKSANFVVGRGSVEYEVYEKAATSLEATLEDTPVPLYFGMGDEEYDIDWGFMDIENYTVITNDGMEDVRNAYINGVMTADGYVDYRKYDAFAITKENADAFGDGSSGGTLTPDSDNTDRPDDSDDDPGNLEPDDTDDPVTDPNDPSKVTMIKKVARAENSNNFIFVGKGWGHGVGISQYGSYDLAINGYTAEEILAAYFVGVDFIDYRQTNNFK